MSPELSPGVRGAIASARAALAKERREKSERPQCDCPYSGPLWSEKTDGTWAWQTCEQCTVEPAHVSGVGILGQATDSTRSPS